MISRRTFLKTAALGSAGVAVGAAVRDINTDTYTGKPIVEKITLAVPNLPPAFNGYRIGFLTDLHLGLWVPTSWITHALDTLKGATVDILILGGDYIFVSDNPVWSIAHCIRNEEFRSLSREEMTGKAFHDVLRIIADYNFKDGTCGVVGNHEHWNSIELFNEAAKEFPSIKILLNEEISVTRGEESLDILGVDDFLTGFPIKPPPRRGAPETHARILVSHNPDYVATLLEEDKHSFDVALCGHTHGGQVRIPGLTNTIIPVQDPRFLSGLTSLEGAYVYTSRGLGVVGLPFRFNCPPEITILTLNRG